MIKALVDTNVLLAVMVDGRPDSEAAASLFNRMLSGDNELAMYRGCTLHCVLRTVEAPFTSCGSCIGSGYGRDA